MKNYELTLPDGTKEYFAGCSKDEAVREYAEYKHIDPKKIKARLIDYKQKWKETEKEVRES